MTYQIAAGHDNEAGLTAIDPQPRMSQLAPGRRQVAGNGMVYEDGFETATLDYGYLTKVQYDALLTAFGLDSAASAQVTIRVPRNSDRTFQNYNAVIVRPASLNLDRGKWLGVSFQLQRIEAI
jgi:hypothetical protein